MSRRSRSRSCSSSKSRGRRSGRRSRRSRSHSCRSGSGGRDRRSRRCSRSRSDKGKRKRIGGEIQHFVERVVDGHAKMRTRSQAKSRAKSPTCVSQVTWGPVTSIPHKDRADNMDRTKSNNKPESPERAQIIDPTKDHTKGLCKGLCQRIVHNQMKVPRTFAVI